MIAERWHCAMCARTLGRLRNSALCRTCYQTLTTDGLRWCPRCCQPRPLFVNVGYCATCRVDLDRERNHDPVYRAQKNARARARRRSMETQRCAHCGAILPHEKRHNQTCSPACARAFHARAPKHCDQCGTVIVGADISRRRFCGVACAKAYRRHEPKPETAPVLVAPQNPAQRVVGHILGREGQTTYVVGVLNGRVYVFDGPGRIYCPIAQWAASHAGRRAAGRGERSIFDEVRAGRNNGIRDLSD